jgi:pyruvate-ferredoxin/flavodoxin oxidoreductase
MAELADEWSAHGRQNVWGVVPRVVQLQSEAGVAGAVHGALQAGALTTTFTSSQGLLLMIPNLYKIAGELTPFCMHVAARTLATHALTIFGDHSDVMACRQIGLGCWPRARCRRRTTCGRGARRDARDAVPFLHFFDGFRTSHEVSKISELSDERLRAWWTSRHRRAPAARAGPRARRCCAARRRTPTPSSRRARPRIRFYDACPEVVQRSMDRFGELTGRRYKLFDYDGHPEAERVVVLMGSGAEVAHEAVDWLWPAGERSAW